MVQMQAGIEDRLSSGWKNSWSGAGHGNLVDDGGRVKWKVFGGVKRAAIYVGLEFSEYRKKKNVQWDFRDQFS